MIYVISHYYPPVQNAPANRMNHLVRALCEAHGGENVTVLTGRPNHPDGKLPAEYAWRWCKRRPGLWGETLLSLYESPAANKGFLKKTFGYVSFAAAVGVFMLFRRFRPGDVVFVTSPPIFPAYAVYVVSLLRRRLRYILDVRDLWPQAIAGIGFITEDSFAYRTFLGLTNRLYRRASWAVGVSTGIDRELAQYVPDDRRWLIHNPVNTDFFSPLPAAEVDAFRAAKPEIFADPERKVFLYSGVHAAYIDLLTLMRAVDVARKTAQNFLVLLIGHGEDKENMQAYARDNGLEAHVLFLPFMDRDELKKYICAADYCYVSLKDVPTLKYAIPTKTLEFLACDKPVVTVLGGPFADLLAEHGATIPSPAGDPAALAGLLVDLVQSPEIRRPAKAPREFVMDHFSVERFRTDMLDCFEKARQ